MAQAQTAVLQADPAQDKATAAKPSNVRWRIFAIVFALTVINLVDRVSLSIAMPTIAGEFQLTPSMQGLILSSFWAYALLQIPGGWLIDRYGPRRVIGWSTGLWGAFQTLAARQRRPVADVRPGRPARKRRCSPAASSTRCGWLQRTPRRRADGLRRAAGRRSADWSSPT